jgi:hypothetical protein
VERRREGGETGVLFMGRNNGWKAWKIWIFSIISKMERLLGMRAKGREAGGSGANGPEPITK